MNLIRFVGRAMLGGYFVARGAKTFMNPSEAIEEHPELIDKMMPLVEKMAPRKIIEQAPQDPTVIARFGGGTQMLGGAMLLTGIGRRLGANLLVASMVPHLLDECPVSQGKALDLEAWLERDFLTTAALLGATLIASQDTQGKPSMIWRLSHRPFVRRHKKRALRESDAVDSSSITSRVEA